MKVNDHVTVSWFALGGSDSDVDMAKNAAGHTAGDTELPWLALA
jgi:hypothetical protein